MKKEKKQSSAINLEKITAALQIYDRKVMSKAQLLNIILFF